MSRSSGFGDPPPRPGAPAPPPPAHTGARPSCPPPLGGGQARHVAINANNIVDVAVGKTRNWSQHETACKLRRWIRRSDETSFECATRKATPSDTRHSSAAHDVPPPPPPRGLTTTTTAFVLRIRNTTTSLCIPLTHVLKAAAGTPRAAPSARAAPREPAAAPALFAGSVGAAEPITNWSAGAGVVDVLVSTMSGNEGGVGGACSLSSAGWWWCPCPSVHVSQLSGQHRVLNGPACSDPK